MPKIFATSRVLFLLLPLIGALAAGPAVTGHAAAADMQEKPAARWRMSEYSSRSCAEDCIAQCRAAKAQCLTAKERADECRARFQICARRCVVSCSAR